MSLKVISPLSIASTLASIALFPQHTVAQIVPDSTLPIDSIVTIEDAIQRITGGTQAGGNLFHSFGEFNVRTGETAFFDNPLTVENIMTRVTGGQISNIDGLIRANGTADLFLINPSGILFGANASLDIGGSFIGSTANSIQFDDGRIFSATNPDASPLLTVSVPIGLQFNSSPSSTGEIRVEGLGHDIDQPNLQPHIRGNVRGLQVPTGNTFALVGGNITFEGGVVTAEAGRIELGSVASGEVNLRATETGWILGYEGVPNFLDIALRSQSAIDASGEPGGSIHVRGQNWELLDGSVALVQHQGSQIGGEQIVNLSGTLTLIGLDPDDTPPSRITSETVGEGDLAGLSISARQVVLQDGGQINNLGFSAGTTGDISLNVAESILVEGVALSPNGTSFLSNIANVSIFNSGTVGDLELSARQLTILDGGQIFSLALGSGDGGNVTVNVTDSVELIGFSPNFAGSSLAATTFNTGNAGNITVNTARLVLRDGGRVDANTIATGDAGSVTVNASEFVEVSGMVTAPEVTTPTQIGSAANTPDPALQDDEGGLILAPIPSGSPGNVTIDTPELRVSDGGLVTVQNNGSGNAGNLSIRVDSIFLDDGGITASTDSGEGGNLSLEVRDSLQLRNGSQIDSEAGGTGNGGNITLNTDTLALLEASRINANAFEGTGGNIAINTQGIFVSPDSAITASSQLGVDGIVQITNPDVDAGAGLVELSSETTDPSDRIVSGCAGGSSFTVTGRGGLIEDPMSVIRGETVWEDWQHHAGNDAALETSSQPIRVTPLEPVQKLVEATGWVVRDDGTVELVAERTGVPGFWGKAPQCNG